MSLWQLLVLAIVQGLTEFLPISSSAHLILASDVLGWPDQGLAVDTAVHLGTLSAIVWYFRGDLAAMAGSLRPAGSIALRRQLQLLAMASIPALAVGFVGASWIESHLRNGTVIAMTTIGFALLLWQADHYGRRIRALDEIRWRDALIIGLLQVLALMPGTSRAGITMTAGLWLGLQRTAAARFSFLLAIPVLAGAGFYSLLKLLGGNAHGFDASGFMLSASIAAIVALATVHLFVRFVERVGMLPFVVYRLILGAALLWFFVF